MELSLLNLSSKGFDRFSRRFLIYYISYEGLFELKPFYFGFFANDSLNEIKSV